MKQTPRLQLALDVLNLETALEATRRAHQSIDIIEVGTLLCLSEGMQAIRLLRAEFPEKIIVGDVRIVRAGRNIAEMAFDAGADWITVVGEAPLVSIEAAVKVAEIYEGEIQVELNPDWTRDQAKQWRQLGIEQVIYHSTAEVDALGAGWSPQSLETIRHLNELGFKVTVTGGIQLETISSFSGFPVFIFIAGRSIVKASDPASVARQFKAALEHLND